MPVAVSVSPEVRGPSGTGVVRSAGEVRAPPPPVDRQSERPVRRPFRRVPGGLHRPVLQRAVRRGQEALRLEGPPLGRPPEALRWASGSRVSLPRNRWRPISPSSLVSPEPQTQRPIPVATVIIRCIIAVPRTGLRTIIIMPEETDIMGVWDGGIRVMPTCRIPASVCGTR